MPLKVIPADEHTNLVKKNGYGLVWDFVKYSKRRRFILNNAH
jgi:hypothetical protein